MKETWLLKLYISQYLEGMIKPNFVVTTAQMMWKVGDKKLFSDSVTLTAQ